MIPKKGKIYKGEVLNEVTVTAPKYKGPKIRRMTNAERSATKFIGGTPPIVGIGKFIPAVKGFNIAKGSPFVSSNITRVIDGVAEGLSISDWVRENLMKKEKRGKSPS